MKARQARYAIARPSSRPSQHGVALVTGLILLMVLTILGISAMRSSTEDTRIAVNYEHKQQSFEAAENALTKMMNSDPGTVVPTTLSTSTPRTHTDYFSSADVEGQADVSADLTVTYRETQTNLLVSGHRVNATAYVYQADATGTVDGTGAKTSNRMGIALIR